MAHSPRSSPRSRTGSANAEKSSFRMRPARPTVAWSRSSDISRPASAGPRSRQPGYRSICAAGKHGPCRPTASPASQAGSPVSWRATSGNGPQAGQEECLWRTAHGNDPAETWSGESTSQPQATAMMVKAGGSIFMSGAHRLSVDGRMTSGAPAILRREKAGTVL